MHVPYTWQVPIFFVGKESDTVDHKSENIQLTQVGSTGGPAHHNDMYTIDFYLYTRADGNVGIAGHPQRTVQLNNILAKSVTDHFTCHAQGVWASARSDPYRTLSGHCKGLSVTFPAGPNLDYEYGTFKLPTAHTPWNATPSDHCILGGKPHSACVNAKMNSDIRYIAQKIRVPINHGVSVYAEFGTLYRSMKPDDLRYECKGNVYLKNILPTKDCLKKSYLSGGWSAPYFAVGYEFIKKGVRYDARYIYIPEKENSDRLAWRDATDTQIYAISVSDGKTPNKEIRQNFNEALDVIRKIPAVYAVLGKHFFVNVLKHNNLYKKPKKK